jgi:hypothetical protein
VLRSLLPLEAHGEMRVALWDPKKKILLQKNNIREALCFSSLRRLRFLEAARRKGKGESWAYLSLSTLSGRIFLLNGCLALLRDQDMSKMW